MAFSRACVKRGLIGDLDFRYSFSKATFASAYELRQRIEDFIEYYNPESKPFKWRKSEVSGVQLKDTINNC